MHVKSQKDEFGAASDFVTAAMRRYTYSMLGMQTGARTDLDDSGLRCIVPARFYRLFSPPSSSRTHRLFVHAARPDETRPLTVPRCGLSFGSCYHASHCCASHYSYINDDFAGESVLFPAKLGVSFRLAQGGHWLKRGKIQISFADAGD